MPSIVSGAIEIFQGRRAHHAREYAEPFAAFETTSNHVLRTGSQCCHNNGSMQCGRGVAGVTGGYAGVTWALISQAMLVRAERPSTPSAVP